jgi:hypothetical protein
LVVIDFLDGDINFFFLSFWRSFYVTGFKEILKSKMSHSVE